METQQQHRNNTTSLGALVLKTSEGKNTRKSFKSGKYLKQRINLYLHYTRLDQFQIYFIIRYKKNIFLFLFYEIDLKNVSIL